MLSAVPLLSIEHATLLCDQIPTQKEECYFLLAETSLAPNLCTKCPDFQLDCEMHILTKLLETRSDYPELLKEVNRPPDDLFGWSTIYRHLLLVTTVLDPNWCTQQKYPDICKKALYGTFSDRLNQLFRCSKEHPKLTYRHDKTLESMYTQRQKTCP
jgi:hypothetical protein